jgi:glycosyltransferase involved in cell wall biosynthesis
MPYQTVGFESDAKIYKKVIEELFPDKKIIIVDSDKATPLEHDKIHIYISNVDKKWFPFADVKMLMINHELFFQSEKDKDLVRYGELNYVLCRTQIGYDWALKIKMENKFKYSIVLTKFTTIFPQIDIQKIQNLILHSAGEHHWKQTDSIIKAWQKYPDLPLLVLTCTGQCFRNVEPILKKGGYPKNIHFHKKLLDHAKFVTLKNQAGIHLCPSIVEGYGHYINESRKVKSLVITTNFPPMNELVDDTCGVLIECSSYGTKKNGTKLCFVTEDDIYVAVKKSLNLPIDTRNMLVEKAYERYENDTKEFSESMKKVIMENE